MQYQGVWAVEILQYTASLHASLQGSGDPSVHCLIAGVSGQWGSFPSLWCDVVGCGMAWQGGVGWGRARRGGPG